MRSLLLCILTYLLVVACSDTTGDYSNFAHLPVNGWAYDDTIHFSPDTIDADSRNITIAIRHNNNYEYRNLWLEVSYLSPDSILHSDTVSMELADIYGHWLGKGLGASFQMESVVNKPVKLSLNSRVGLRHIMRVDTLYGIEQIGVTLTK